MKYWLGLDVGTSSVKAVAIGAEGEVAASARCPYVTHRSGPEMAEQDPADYLKAVRTTISALEIDSTKIAAVGLSGHTPTTVLVDENDEPVRPAMTWQDRRAEEEAQVLSRRHPDPIGLFGTPLYWSPTAIPAKLLWLSRHEPGTVANTRWILQPKDYIGLALTGAPTSDPWSSKGLCNVVTGAPASAFLRSVGWSDGVCPPIDHAWNYRGAVTEIAAHEFGLPDGIPVAVGWSDALAAMLRVGAFTSQTAFIISGTSDIVGSTFRGDAPDVPGLLTIPRECAPLPATYGPIQSSGDSLEWLARILGRSVSDLMFLQPSPAVEPPTFVPYLRGERAPYWNLRVRGGFSGLSAEHNAGDLVQGAMEGISFAARRILDNIGVGESSEVHLAGVGAEERWAQVRAATLGRPIVIHKDGDAAAVGAAILGAAASGQDIAAVVSRVSRNAQRVDPAPSDAEDARRRFAAFGRLSAFALAETASPAPSKRGDIVYENAGSNRDSIEGRRAQ
ncbi:FGGY family carbohydrate kinase [Jiangella anatolica]|uniref:Carbohydrate kinase n=1 Tax=Jiangella anatolica TaxID=2670374 RepID=A0A2W2B2B2_9ACTN|nr:FGGY family carbohydrate kinase [Jiangella anatolica]PZF80142.1 hypothetical protein C1I92_27555 [Jiangella anatolica]